jgi:hypothetical protein
MNTSRRSFVIHSLAGAGIAATAVLGTQAQAQAAVVETDAQAAALGYKADATKVDKVKFPKYAAGQACSSCALYAGKAGDATGPCPLFAGKVVSSKGWCSAYAKKA